MSTENNPFDQITPNYPGYDLENRRICNIGLSLVKEGVVGYYKVFGNWPLSWSAVTDTGIVQALSRGANGEWIDPDDRQLDFEFDVTYSLEDGSPKFESLIGGDVIDSEVQIPRTYQQQGQAIFGATNNDAYLALVQDMDICRLFALLGVCHHMLMVYIDLHGNAPCTWTEFIESGLAPIDEASRNPVTGGSLANLGGAWGIDYIYGGEREFGLIHLDANGEHPRYIMSY